MIEFTTTTAFSLVRRLGISELDAPSIYLVLCEPAAVGAVRSDIESEIKVQLGAKVRTLKASELVLEKLETVFYQDVDRILTLLLIDEWLPHLVDSFDRNVVLLAQAGILIFLANHQIGERMLSSAPNLRNRFTDVLAITPEA